MHSGIVSLSQRDVPRHRAASDGTTRDANRRERPQHHHDHHHLWTRRHVLQAGIAVLGTTAALSVFPGRAGAARPGSGIPKQLPDFSPALKDAFGIEIPFFLPVEVDPFTADPEAVATPTTIWDFNGTVGLVEADGVSDPGHTADDEPRRWSCDVRFMRGVFVDRAGRTQRGAFGFF